MLEKIKEMLGITGNYHDPLLQNYIDEVKQYLLDGGVQLEVVESATSAGTIAKGVIDLWDYGSGNGKLSPYFKERAIQLAMKRKSSDGGTEPSGDGYKAGENIEITSDGTINVLTTNEAAEDNTRPITSAGCFAIVGNIEALLKTI